MESSKILFGCVGWSYEDWLGPFYPKDMKPKDYLRFYAEHFPVVEIDSTFYSLPNNFLVNRWKYNTPDDFTFTVKMPQIITHKKKLREVGEELFSFYSVISTLKPKIGCILLQMPPSFNYALDHIALENFLANGLEKRFRYAIELRNASWFQGATYDLLTKYNVCLVWSINQFVEETPSHITTDFVYLRFIGDRSLTKFDRIQIDRSKIVSKWAEILVEKMDSVSKAYVFSNNHFAGFAPSTIEQFRSALQSRTSNFDKSK